MSIRARSFRSMTVVAIAFALLLIGTPLLYAPTAVERGTASHWFGMVGITRVQTARLNVVFVENPTTTNARLRVEMFFFDDQGNVIARSGQQPLIAGKALSHELGVCPSVGSCGDAKEKLQFRAGVVVTGEWDKKGSNPFQFVAGTLELLDNETRTTHVVMVPSVQITMPPV